MELCAQSEGCVDQDLFCRARPNDSNRCGAFRLYAVLDRRRCTIATDSHIDANALRSALCGAAFCVNEPQPMDAGSKRNDDRGLACAVAHEHADTQRIHPNGRGHAGRALGSIEEQTDERSSDRREIGRCAPLHRRIVVGAPFGSGCGQR